MTTINSYSIGLGLDARSYIDSAKLTRSETAKLTRQINAVRSPTEKFNQEQTLLNHSLRTGAIDRKVYDRLLAEARDKHNKAAAAVNAQWKAQSKLNEHIKRGAELSRKSAASTGSLSSSLGGIPLKAVGIAAVAAGVAKIGSNAIEAASSLEDMQLRLELQMGSVQKAADLMDELKDFTATTPFRLSEVQSVATGLIAAKVPASEITQQMRILGNVAAAAGTGLEDMSQILIQAQMTSQVSLMDLTRLGNRGIPVFDLLAKRFGIAESELRKYASSGKVSVDDLKAVFAELGGEGGRFSDATQRMSETFSGSMSTAADAVTMFLGAAGKPLTGMLKEVAKEFNGAAAAATEFGIRAKAIDPDTILGRTARAVDISAYQTEGASDFWAGMMGLPTIKEMERAEKDHLDFMRASVERHRRRQAEESARFQADPIATFATAAHKGVMDLYDSVAGKSIETAKVAFSQSKSFYEKAAEHSRQIRKEQARSLAENSKALDSLKVKEQKVQEDRLAAVVDAQQKMREAIAGGISGGSTAEDLAFLKKQENERIAAEATESFGRDRGFEEFKGVKEHSKRIEQISTEQKELQRQQLEVAKRMEAAQRAAAPIKKA